MPFRRCAAYWDNIADPTFGPGPKHPLAPTADDEGPHAERGIRGCESEHPGPARSGVCPWAPHPSTCCMACAHVMGTHALLQTTVCSIPHTQSFFEGKLVDGDLKSGGHILQAISGSGPSRQTFNYSTDRVVGNGSFGVVYQATCLETGETVGQRLWWTSSQICPACMIFHGTEHELRTVPFRCSLENCCIRAYN